MEKTYSPESIEKSCYQTWEDNGHFKAKPADESYCIMIPPPNVTGTLHMGHAFQDTIMDMLIRFHRMKGKETLWQAGSDHAGIATQMVVERQLNAQGKTRHDLGREKFIDKIWDWKEHSGGIISSQLRRMGSSLDWERERFTMDEGLSEAVQKVFIQLYDEGLIYRGKRLVNWDPVLHTALSDLEVISTEESGFMWHMKYPITGTDEFLTVATTRPETMLGDSAVAVHPDDARYQHLVGKTVDLPLCDRTLPIIADDYVDPEFGTGVVKITPAHDFNDYEVGQRHALALHNILTIDAKINDASPEAYRGMDRYVARKQIVADLKALGLLDKIDDHKLMVPRGDRSHTVVEPLLTDQWYVKIQELADPAIDAVKTGKIKFIPENWDKTYFNWMDNIQDWCISRQLWWGHRIPAWYDEDGKIYVGDSEKSIRKKYSLADSVVLRQDDDVLDTWFSSALWPFSTLGWPEKTPELKTFYPTSVLVTGFDIIFFWVARMIMFGIKFMDDVPFKEIYIHGLVRDSHGKKMSKSKGNVLDPIDVIDGIELEALVTKRGQNLMQPEMAPKIEKQTRKDFPNGISAFGTDALRFTFASLASTGRDINFDLKRVEGYRNFCNKLWNAARYVLMNAEGFDNGLNAKDEIELSVSDKWIISRLQQVEAEVERHFNQYRFDLAANLLYEFTWSEYCGWYLELSKPVLNNDNASDAQKRGTRRTLVRVMETLLRLLHPMVPFITEEIWQTVAPLAAKEGDTIMNQPFPQSDESKIDQDSLEQLAWIQDFILGIRRIRAEMDIAPGKPLPVLLSDGDSSDVNKIKEHALLIKSLARLESITWLEGEAPEAAIALVGKLKLLIPLAGLIDKDAELTRLNREIEKLDKEMGRLAGKLNNKNFVDRAPEAVVAKEKEKLGVAQESLQQLKAQAEKIKTM